MATNATWPFTSRSCRGCIWLCAMEDRHPIVEIMEQTPDIPDSCQWAVFLRNHDELTLEMVTDRERDYHPSNVCGRPSGAPPSGHSPPARAIAGERPAPD